VTGEINSLPHPSFSQCSRAIRFSSVGYPLTRSSRSSSPSSGFSSSDLPRPGHARFEPRVQVSSVKEEWVRLTVRIWIRRIPERDRVVSEYLDSAVERLKAEDLLDEKKWEDEPGAGPAGHEMGAVPG